MVPPLKFKGSCCLRQRIILSLLTGRAIQIDDIRDGEPLLEHERNLLDLIEAVTSGTKIQYSKGKLSFVPGTIVGGQVTHDCNLERCISYYLEVLLCIAPFCKKAFQITLTGVTNDQVDPNIDALKASAIPTLKRFLGDIEGVKTDIKVHSRGYKPDGGGKIEFTCPTIKQLQPVKLTESGKIKRVRGVAVAARVSPQMANRLIDTAKGALLRFLPDVYIHSDHTQGKTSGLSPGFSVSLSAETTEGCIYTASAVSNHKGSGKGPTIPEDLAKDATCMLFEEIRRGGCVDSICQSMALTFMAFNQKDVSTIRFGPLTTYSVLFLRHLKEFAGITFKLEADTESDEVIATCAGIGFKNLSKPTY